MTYAPHIQTHRASMAKQGKTNPEGWEAFGFPVPYARRTRALAAYRSMNPDITTEQAMKDLDLLCTHIERDQPYEAEAYWRHEIDGSGYQSPPRRDLDLTGYYRLMAELMTGPA